MKKILMTTVLVAATCALAQQTQQKKDAYDIKPAAAKPVDAPTSTDWQKAHADALAKAVAPEELASYTRSEAAAAALLWEVKTGYATKPVKAFQIGAVTQYVMTPAGAAGRKVWASQLLAFAARPSDPDLKQFFLDQLRWCGCAGQAAQIRAVGAAAGDKGVKDFAEQVAAELDKSAAVRAPLR